MPRAATLKAELPALLALFLPVAAGAIHMAAFGAPTHYALVNLAALVLAGAWIVAGRGPDTAFGQRILAGAMLAVLLLPILTGPWLNGIARWIAVGPVSLNTGMLAVPALVLIASRDERFGPMILIAALALLAFQPDAAGGFAITFAAVGLHHVSKDWRIGLVAVIGFFASIVMAMRGELPAVPFVERVLVDAAIASPAVGLGLALALLASFVLILTMVNLRRAERYALAGALFGFALTALMSNYPTPLIGYGAAAILGFALALGLDRKTAS